MWNAAYQLIIPGCRLQAANPESVTPVLGVMDSGPGPFGAVPE